MFPTHHYPVYRSVYPARGRVWALSLCNVSPHESPRESRHTSGVSKLPRSVVQDSRTARVSRVCLPRRVYYPSLVPRMVIGVTWRAVLHSASQRVSFHVALVPVLISESPRPPRHMRLAVAPAAPVSKLPVPVNAHGKAARRSGAQRRRPWERGQAHTYKSVTGSRRA